MGDARWRLTAAVTLERLPNEMHAQRETKTGADGSDAPFVTPWRLRKARSKAAASLAAFEDRGGFAAPYATSASGSTGSASDIGPIVSQFSLTTFKMSSEAAVAALNASSW